ncbi:MAG: ABC transporter permease [Verrucomicrobiae bacterium]|nr:ABC transporter permease [Verrucomicrobiae bacterium]
MNWLGNVLREIGEAVFLMFSSFGQIRYAPQNRDKIIGHILDIGNASLPMVVILSVFIGGVLSLQTGYALASTGLQSRLGTIVGLSMARELGPMMMAVLLAGRVGSAIAAELASMSVYQEIDALKTMNINPIRFLVMPRMLALVLAMPVLVIVADFVGWVGGGLVAAVNYQINVPFNSYFQNLQMGVQLEDVTHGLWKSMLFGLIIATVCCFKGITTKGGPREIGHTVTKAVVGSIVLITIFDYFVTRILI